MSSPTVELFKEMIKGAEEDIAALQDQIDTNPPPTPQRIQTLHDLQHMRRATIDKLLDSIAELK
jgi:hypothetical protein